jgi:hypothetical protein
MHGLALGLHLNCATGNDIFSLLVWQLGDMVPTLKVKDTIEFEQPLFIPAPWPAGSSWHSRSSSVSR